MGELAELPAAEQAEAVAGGSASAVELVTASLSRIAGFDSELHAFLTVDAEVAAVAESAYETLEPDGAQLVDVRVDLPDPWSGYGEIYTADARHGLADFVEHHGAELLPETIAELDGWEWLTAAEGAHAWYELRAFRAARASLFDVVDLLCSPATASAAFPCGEPPSWLGGRAVDPGWATFMPFSVPWNATGQPTASVPAGRTRAGLPVGLLIVGRHGAEAAVLRAARALELAGPGASRFPSNRTASRRPRMTDPARAQDHRPCRPARRGRRREPEVLRAGARPARPVRRGRVEKLR